MSQGQRGFRLHVSTVVVVVVGLAAASVGFLAASSSVRENDDALLRQSDAQGAVVLNAYLAQVQVPLTKLASLLSSDGMSPAAFDAAAGDVSKSDDGQSLALLHQVGEHLKIVASLGPLHRSFGGPADAALLKSLATADVQYTQVVTAGGERWLGELFGPKAVGVPAGYAIYSELAIPPVLPLSDLKGIPFSGIQAAVYLGAERPSDLFFSTTRDLPLPGEQAVASFGGALSVYSYARLTDRATAVSVPRQLILVMIQTGNLSGSSTAILPWLILSLGALATLVVAVLLAVALRRRDQALLLVQDLEEKNTEIDRSLKREAEAQESLRRAQRMEAVGKLAGGIAHDFNNLLHVILSYASFLSDSLEPENPLREDVAEVQKAARRAAELTRQLLVFSRRDVVRPSVVDLNEVVLEAERLLRHTLGEDITLSCVGCDEPCPVLADQGELAQVLMNLAINSRDAMPNGGSLVILLERVDLAPDEAVPAGLRAGPHVRVDVVDTGTGMSPEVAARAFEPFFTTKETGRGTGLGLAMVYGIVERWDGSVSLASTPGEGTTVTLVFPVSTSPPDAQADSEVVAVPARGAGTVLLVEDETGVRRAGARVLESAGYTVLQASDASEAERLFAETEIDLLVTDVVMPGGKTGKQLADDLSRRCPDLPVVFVSGYGAEAIAERGVLPASTSLLEKPFTAEQLLEVVRCSMIDPERASI